MSQLATPHLTTPHQDGFAMPAEWASHDAVWMIWPYRTDNWREQGIPAQKRSRAWRKPSPKTRLLSWVCLRVTGRMRNK